MAEKKTDRVLIGNGRNMSIFASMLRGAYKLSVPDRS